ncbi:MAG: hypothetical protein AMXMBFR66_18200 [Pseudomonadota bacterium]|nr:response regulator [Rubrivivax sp.]NLZ41446.1 response regulator [Comamonadaceae bacterium]
MQRAGDERPADAARPQAGATTGRHELERAQLALEAADIGVWERDAEGRMVYWNEAMYRMRGLDPADARTFEEIAAACMPPEEHARRNRMVRQRLHQGGTYSTELRVRRPDGSWRWLASQGRALYDAQGRATGMVGVNLDITERKEAELLQREKERVEQASRDKSAFMARVSHELRTPLNAVLGFARLLEDERDEPLTPRQRERLRRIADAGLRLLELVDELLELARAETGAAPAPGPVRAALALAALVDEATQAVAALARTQRVALVRTEVDAGATALADRARLVRALTLVLQHALRRSPAGAQVRLQAGRSAPDPARVFVRVVDDGPRLSAEQHLWLFESFAPEDRATQADDEGGLRLSLARGLVLALDGSLEALAREGGGIEYRIELPAAEPAAPAAPLRVLYVEDDPVNRLLVGELLALRPGVQLAMAEDGAAGLARARAESPDLLLLDMQLPDMHGSELLRALRALPQCAASTFVALSADALHEHVQAALAAGFDAYWTKPIDFERFLAEIDRLAARGTR